MSFHPLAIVLLHRSYSISDKRTSHDLYLLYGYPRLWVIEGYGL